MPELNPIATEWRDVRPEQSCLSRSACACSASSQRVNRLGCSVCCNPSEQGTTQQRIWPFLIGAMCLATDTVYATRGFVTTVPVSMQMHPPRPEVRHYIESGRPLNSGGTVASDMGTRVLLHGLLADTSYTQPTRCYALRRWPPHPVAVAFRTAGRPCSKGRPVSPYFRE